MKDMGRVRGSAEMAKPLVIGADTVYVHTDIQPVTEDQDGKPLEGQYEYHEVQYPKDEYIRLMAEQGERLEGQLTDAQLAMCEIYEAMLGGVE